MYDPAKVIHASPIYFIGGAIQHPPLAEPYLGFSILSLMDNIALPAKQQSQIRAAP